MKFMGEGLKERGGLKVWGRANGGGGNHADTGGVPDPL